VFGCSARSLDGDRRHDKPASGGNFRRATGVLALCRPAIAMESKLPARSTSRLALPLLLLAGSSHAAGDTDPVQRGQALLERNCAGCHAIGPTGDSAMPEAPPFREVKKLYPIETLAEPLAEGIVGGHPEMPVRAFAPEDIDAILAYLATL